jgi:hypothetical protein
MAGLAQIERASAGRLCKATPLLVPVLILFASQIDGKSWSVGRWPLTVARAAEDRFDGRLLYDNHLAVDSLHADTASDHEQ